MSRVTFVAALFAFASACDHAAGERCNPAAYADDPTRGDCAAGLACVYPTAPSCGVAYCCAVDAVGHVTDTHPRCQPDPSLAPACALDLGDATD